MATVDKRTWKNKSGEHEAWRLSYTDSQGKRHKLQFPTKREAEAKRIEVQGQISSGTYRAEASSKTVADACQAYLDACKDRHLQDQKMTTTYLNTIRGEVWNYIAQELRPEGHDKTGSRVTPFSEGVGKIKLSQFTSLDVRDWSKRMQKQGISVSTVKRLIATLSRILSYTISDKGWVAINVAKGVRVISSRKAENNKRVTPPAKADLKALLEQAQAEENNPGLYIRILFAASSGLRASEQWALRWGDLDLEACKVTVDKRLDIFGQIDTTKSAAGVRTVPLGKGVVAALQEWRRQTNRVADKDIVFPDSAGSHTRHGNFLKRSFDPFKEKVGLRALTWHALRHYAISTWIEAELKPKVVQTFAGHATLSITMDRYGHLFPSEDHSAAMDKVAESLLA